MKILSILVICILTSVSAFAQSSTDLVQKTTNDFVILANAFTSVSLSKVSLSVLQLPIMSSSVAGGSVVSLVKAGAVATSVSGIAVASSAGAGYFFGKMIVTTDEVYLDGALVDSVGKILSPVFYGVYKVQSYLENR